MRMLSLQPSISLTLRSLGRLDALIGCTRYCLEVVPELRSRKLAVVRDSWSSETEEIVALHPDLVIASVPYRQESLAAILRSGIPVLALAPHCLADIYNDIQLIGGVVNQPGRAIQVVAEMRDAIAGIAKIAACSGNKPLVYCEEWGKPLIHSQPWVRELVEAAGGVFLGEAGKATTAEAIATADPEVIALAWCGAGDRVPVKRVIAMRGWEHLRAVRAGQVVCIPDELLNTPAPTLVEGLRALARVIHPELFSPGLLAHAQYGVSPADNVSG
jgi:iron complex transport system substrate-binding protein